MKKAIIIIVVLLCAGAFVFGAATLGAMLNTYWSAQRVYSDTADKVTTAVSASSSSVSVPQLVLEPSEQDEEEPQELVIPPIRVNFEELMEINPDVVGWIYCEDTVINYPILKGEDNDFYLHHDINRNYSVSATIFQEAYNSDLFADANNLLYGHHMADGSMFAGLEKFKEPGYYEAHPIMWLFTPEQSYKILLFSSYVTDAWSDAYVIYTTTGPTLDKYIQERLELSDFHADVEFSGKDKLALLSTCDYTFNNARYVVHGILRPVQLVPEGEEEAFLQKQAELQNQES